MERDLSGRCGSCGWFFALQTDDAGVSTGECRLGCWPSPLKDTATCASHKPIGSSWKNALVRKPVAGAPRRYRERDDDDDEPALPEIPREIGIDMDRDEFRDVLRQVIQEELGLSPTHLAERWRGGEVVLIPGKKETQEKRVPLDQFFHKIVMIRDKLRVLEQKINAHPGLAADEKLQIQQYVTQCYGTLTTFNVLFRDKADNFVGQSGKGD